MEIKGRVERNPIMYLLVSAVSVSTIVVGVAEYFCRQRIDVANQKSELRISTLESELTSIRRGLGENNYLDIRKFVYSKDQFAVLRANPKAKYVSADNFYTIVNLPGWQYATSSFEEYARRAEGVTLPPATKKFMGKNRMYTWNATETLDVEGPGNFSESGPSIEIQRYPAGIPAGITKEDYSKFVKEWSGSEPKLDEVWNPTEYDYSKAGIDPGDIVTFQLETFMQFHHREFLGTPDIISQLVELEKVENVLYVQVLATVRNATVNGKKLPVFFVRYEEILIAGKGVVTLILITVPSADPAPRGPVYAQIQEWFSGLAIPVG